MLDEGAAVYDECERTRLREVELPRVHLNIMSNRMMASSALSRNGQVEGAGMARELELSGLVWLGNRDG